MEFVVILVFAFAAICQALTHGMQHNYPRGVYLVSINHFHRIETIRSILLILTGILCANHVRNWVIVVIMVLVFWESMELIYSKQRFGKWFPEYEKLVLPLFAGWHKEWEYTVTGNSVYILHAMRIALIGFFYKLM